MNPVYNEEAKQLYDMSVWQSNDEYIDKEKEREKEYLQWKATWQREVKKRRKERIRDKVMILEVLLYGIFALYVVYELFRCYIKLEYLTRNDVILTVSLAFITSIVAFGLKKLWEKKRESRDS